MRYANRQKRVRYCSKKLRENEGFTRHVFCDETVVQMHSNKAYGWVPADERYAHVLPAPKYTMKVMVVAAISWRGPAHLVIMAPGKTINASVYQSILEKSILPWAQVKNRQNS